MRIPLRVIILLSRGPTVASLGSRISIGMWLSSLSRRPVRAYRPESVDRHFLPSQFKSRAGNSCRADIVLLLNIDDHVRWVYNYRRQLSAALRTGGNWQCTAHSLAWTHISKIRP